tara:strand:- start:429 stop:605 length:177 start_codon:yes stop_codon:yes gene_type:complete
MKFAFIALISTASALSVGIKQDCKYEDLNGDDHCVLKAGYSLEGPGACNPIDDDHVFS